MVVQVPAPAGERWNWAEATPEPPSAELEETVTAVPRTFAEAAGAVSEPLGAVESFTSVSTVAAEVLPAASVLVTDSVGEALSAAGQAKLLVVTYGPPAGVETVWVVCVQPPTVPPSAGKIEEAGPEPASATAFWRDRKSTRLNSSH